MEKHPKRGPKVPIFLSNGLKENGLSIEKSFEGFSEVRGGISAAIL
jgi:hypothetical protein